jgi:hypothetical protein
VVDGSGKPNQVPEETESSLPVIRVPETSGFEVAKGGLDTADVDAVNLSTWPNEFVAVTRAKMCLPKSASANNQVLEVAPLISEQPDGFSLAGESTCESHLNHRYV